MLLSESVIKRMVEFVEGCSIKEVEYSEKNVLNIFIKYLQNVKNGYSAAIWCHF